MNTDYSYDTSFSTILLCVRVLCVVHTYNVFALCTHMLIFKLILMGGGEPGTRLYSFKLLYIFEFDIPLIISVIYLMPKSRSSALLCDFTEIEMGSMVT